MTNKLALALISAAAVIVASPAFAQASLPNTSSQGTGSLLPFAYPMMPDQPERQANVSTARGDVFTTGALGAFAAEPRSDWNRSADSPAATGGGSIGYNANLDNPNY